MFQKIGIIGLGEIGSAIKELYEEWSMESGIALRDPPRGLNDSVAQCDLVHVCVPGPIVRDVIEHSEPLYIVHSTVPIGTCRKISEEGFKVFHAPVRGNHPMLAAALKTFIMPITGGSKDWAVARTIARHFGSIGIKMEFWGTKWETTEIAKLFCTTRLGLDVLFLREVYDACERYGVDPKYTYERWTAAYNDGYAKLGRPDIARPILRPMVGPISGHCVLPNAELLKDESWIADEVVRRGKENWPKPEV